MTDNRWRLQPVGGLLLLGEKCRSVKSEDGFNLFLFAPSICSFYLPAYKKDEYKKGENRVHFLHFFTFPASRPVAGLAAVLQAAHQGVGGIQSLREKHTRPMRQLRTREGKIL